MKKLVLVLISVLFALSLVTCDAFTPPEAAAEFDWDDLKPGEFYVDVGTGGNRALTSALARAGSDYFEVVLVAREDWEYPTSGDPTSGAATGGTQKVFRATFRDGRNGRMEAPVVGQAYDNVDDGDSNGYFAYIFAGRYDDMTLLGIGILDQIDNGTGFVSGKTISQATRAIQFLVQPLTNNVTADYTTISGTPDTYTSTSTFRPWDATSGINSIIIKDFCAKIMVDGMPAPIFLLPHSQLIEDVPYDIVTAYAAAIRVAPSTLGTPPVAVAPPSVIPRGFIWSDGDYAPIEVDHATTEITNAIPGELIDFPLFLNIDTNVTMPGPVTVTSGLGRLSIEVPVVNFSAADSDNQDIPDLKAPVVWFLRGGLNNAIIDQGPTFNNTRGSMGGAILIGVGNVLAGAGGFIVQQQPAP